MLLEDANVLTVNVTRKHIDTGRESKLHRTNRYRMYSPCCAAEPRSKGNFIPRFGSAEPRYLNGQCGGGFPNGS